MRGKVTVLVFGSMILRITPAYAGKSTIDGGKHDRSKDHPRLCGEKVCLCHMKKESKGSPPPMRGKVAGGSVFASGTRDHPRLCGEKVRQLRTCGSGQGSPPPMRGKVHKIQAYDLYNRITPAYAGKREPVFFGDGVFQDHPRLCGEKMRRFWRRCILQGSPPPMRGKEGLSKRQRNYFGITPAYAGKSFCLLHKKCSV